jgi:hypothetical protein
MEEWDSSWIIMYKLTYHQLSCVRSNVIYGVIIMLGRAYEEWWKRVTIGRWHTPIRWINLGLVKKAFPLISGNSNRDSSVELFPMNAFGNNGSKWVMISLIMCKEVDAGDYFTSVVT